MKIRKPVRIREINQKQAVIPVKTVKKAAIQGKAKQTKNKKAQKVEKVALVKAPLKPVTAIPLRGKKVKTAELRGVPRDKRVQKAEKRATKKKEEPKAAAGKLVIQNKVNKAKKVKVAAVVRKPANPVKAVQVKVKKLKTAAAREPASPVKAIRGKVKKEEVREAGAAVKKAVRLTAAMQRAVREAKPVNPHPRAAAGVPAVPTMSPIPFPNPSPYLNSLPGPPIW